MDIPTFYPGETLSSEKPEFADSEPKDSPDLWEETTLRKLVEKYTPNSTAVRFARKGIKTLPGEKIEWEETKTSKLKPAVEGVGERASPRGDNPTGHRWILKSVDASEVSGTEPGGTRYKITTTWETDDYPEEND